MKLDFKKIAAETAGTAAGLVIVTQVNKIGFIKNIQKPVLKGLAMVAAGQVLLPMLAEKMMGKGKGALANVLNGASAAITTYGVGHIMSNTAATSGMVPKIEGYEDSPYLGAVYEDQSLNGAEEEASVNGGSDVYLS